MESVRERSDEALRKLCAFLTADPVAAVVDSADPSALFLAAPNVEGRKVYAEVTFITAPRSHRVPLYFELPHEIHNGSLCVVTNPPQRKIKDAVQNLREESNDPVAMRVKKIIDTSKLMAKFGDPVVMRAMANSFDHFVLLAVKKFPPQLTGEFLGHQSLPVWTPRQVGGVGKSLHAAVRTCVVSRRGQSTAVCCIGHTGLTVGQLRENLESLLQQLTEHPEGSSWDSILHVRVAGTTTKGKRVGLTVACHHFPTLIATAPAEGKVAKGPLVKGASGGAAPAALKAPKASAAKATPRKASRSSSAAKPPVAAAVVKAAATVKGAKRPAATAAKSAGRAAAQPVASKQKVGKRSRSA